MFKSLCLRTCVVMVAVVVNARVAAALPPTIYLTNPGVYTATPSSTFSDFPGMSKCETTWRVIHPATLGYADSSKLTVDS